MLRDEEMDFRWAESGCAPPFSVAAFFLTRDEELVNDMLLLDDDPPPWLVGIWTQQQSKLSTNNFEFKISKLNNQKSCNHVMDSFQRSNNDKEGFAVKNWSQNKMKLNKKVESTAENRVSEKNIPARKRKRWRETLRNGRGKERISVWALNWIE